MNKLRIVFSFLVLSLVCAGVAHADLDGFLKKVNEQAKADMKKFTVNLSAQFNIPLPKVDLIIKTVSDPADAFMVLQLGRMSNKQPEAVVRIYESNRGKGWGVIAQELGIKPGSPEFHALKRGDFSLTGQPAADAGHGHGKGKGKGRNK